MLLSDFQLLPCVMPLSKLLATPGRWVGCSFVIHIYSVPSIDKEILIRLPNSLKPQHESCYFDDLDRDNRPDRIPTPFKTSKILG